MTGNGDQVAPPSSDVITPMSVSTTVTPVLSRTTWVYAMYIRPANWLLDPRLLSNATDTPPPIPVTGAIPLAGLSGLLLSQSPMSGSGSGGVAGGFGRVGAGTALASAGPPAPG